MTHTKNRLASVIAGVLLASAGASSVAVAQTASGTPSVHRVLLLSVDGLHRQDLARWVEGHPNSALAQLSAHGVTYTNATAPTPSDSFPGLLALVTGGTPKSTGVYYDDSYDRTLYAPGNLTCTDNISGGPGTEVVFDETMDKDTSQLFSGGIDSRLLPRRKNPDGSCTPVYPHHFIRVNTVFEVVKAAGLHTAWSDKHPTYDLVNGPSGAGVEDLYTPEINSLVANGGTVSGINLSGSVSGCNGTNSLITISGISVYTDCTKTQEAYDDIKVKAILNEIDGKSADGTVLRGYVPAIFGMNFQAVSVGQKLTPAGYVDANYTPSAALAEAIAHTDASIGLMVAELQKRGLSKDTLIIVTAKHGQSPANRAILHMKSGATEIAPNNDVTDPGDILANETDSAAAIANNVDAVQFNNPYQPNGGGPYSTAGHLQTDDVGIIWLPAGTSAANVSTIAAHLAANAAAIHAVNLPDDSIFAANITSGAPLAAIYGDPRGADPIAAARAPDIFIQPNEGVIYSGSKKKIAEHGGGAPGDIDVALLVSAPFLGQAAMGASTKTTQVAPTILQALGLDPNALQAVVKEGTKPLTGWSDNVQ
jgi:hypothetical protein